MPGLQQPKVFIYHILPGSTYASRGHLLGLWRKTYSQILYTRTTKKAVAKTSVI